MEHCDALLMFGIDFPNRTRHPQDARVVQADVRGEQIGRRAAGCGRLLVVGSMKRLVLFSAALLAFPSLALADPPWSAPVTATGITDSGTLVSTPGGHDELVGTMADAGLVGSTTLVSPIAVGGRPGAGQNIALSHPRAASFGSDGLVLVGPQTASSVAQARTRALAIAVGKPGAIGKPRAITGTRGHLVYSVAGSPAGLVAFVTGHRYRPSYARGLGAARPRP